MSRVKFITFEGGEGAGKSTLIRKVMEWLTKTGAVGRAITLTREPGGTQLGESVRELLLHGDAIQSRAELFLFLAARIQHVNEVIKPAIERNEIVLCDRFSDSTIAYQGGGRELGVSYVQQCTKLAIGDFQPDLTFYVDVEPETGMLRAGRREKYDRIEKEAIVFHERVRAAFLQLAEKESERIVVLNGMKGRDEVFQDAVGVLRAKL